MTKENTAMAASGRVAPMLWWAAVGLSIIGTFAIVAAGLIRSDFEAAWWILVWLLASMAFYWIFNRVLHGVSGVAGETERDGIVWLAPLVPGVLPCLFFLASSDAVARSMAVLTYGSFIAIGVQFLRPEIPGWDADKYSGWKAAYLEKAGFRWTLLSLLKPCLAVERPPGTPPDTRPTRSRKSTSTLVYFLVFSVTAAGLVYANQLLQSVTSLPALTFGGQVIAAYMTAVAALIGGAIAIIKSTLDTPAEGAGWPIQKGERQILSMLYVASTFNVIGASAIWFAIPWAGNLVALSHVP